MRVQRIVIGLLLLTVSSVGPAAGQAGSEFRRARENGGRFEEAIAACRRDLNLDKNYVRLNELPEWYIVDENTLYRLRDAAGGKERLLLGSELIAGVTLKPGYWTVESEGAPPYDRMGTIPPH